MRSVIYEGDLFHARIKPVRHEFRYSVYFLGLDLDELANHAPLSFAFGYNRIRLFSIFDRDYFPGMTGSIKNRLVAFLDRHGFRSTFSRVEVLTSPRYFGIVFNPVNFYRCFNERGMLDTFVAEVNNTFGETHVYVLPVQEQQTEKKFIRLCAAKQFHVSPFNDRSGEYEFHVLSAHNGQVDIKINIRKDGEVIFLSSISGTAKQLTVRNVFATIVKYPFGGFLALARIWRQAAVLFFVKHQPIYDKPIAESDFTIRRRAPTWFQRVFEKGKAPRVA